MNDEHSKIRKEKKVEAEPEIVKDSEGTEADVSSSVALSQVCFNGKQQYRSLMYSIVLRLT